VALFLFLGNREEKTWGLLNDVGVIAEQGASNADSFWKTFANWANAVEAGTLPLNKSTFELYVSAPRTGPIAELFSQSKQRSGSPRRKGAIADGLLLRCNRPIRLSSLRDFLLRCLQWPESL
jgi:hypothetical protein